MLQCVAVCCSDESDMKDPALSKQCTVDICVSMVDMCVSMFDIRVSTVDICVSTVDMCVSMLDVCISFYMCVLFHKCISNA